MNPKEISQEAINKCKKRLRFESEDQEPSPFINNQGGELGAEELPTLSEEENDLHCDEYLETLWRPDAYILSPSDYPEPPRKLKKIPGPDEFIKDRVQLEEPYEVCAYELEEIKEFAEKLSRRVDYWKHFKVLTSVYEVLQESVWIMENTIGADELEKAKKEAKKEEKKVTEDNRLVGAGEKVEEVRRGRFKSAAKKNTGEMKKEREVIIIDDSDEEEIV